MTLLLAPMEGLLDHTLRDILTRVGGIDRCVSEFIRISGTLLPERAFLRVVPELRHGGRTRSGVPVRAQLLGSDPVCLAENAARLAALGPQQLEVSGGVLRGHAFHYSTCATVLPVAARTQAAPGRKLRGDGEALYAQGSVKASYFHAWFASNPIAAAGLFLKDQHAG